MPEGWAHTWLQTECLMRLLQPPNGCTIVRRARRVLPLHYRARRGAGRVRHRDEPGGWQLKSLCLTRALCLWLNKGVDVMHFSWPTIARRWAWGCLPPGLPKLPPESRFEEAATAPIRALRNLTQTLADSVPMERPRPLTVDIPPWERKDIFAGDGGHAPALAPRRCGCAAVSDHAGPVRAGRLRDDLRRDAAAGGGDYRLTIGGLHGPRLAAAVYDPHTDVRTALQPAAAWCGVDRAGGATGRPPADAAPGRTVIVRKHSWRAAFTGTTGWPGCGSRPSPLAGEGPRARGRSEQNAK